MLGGEFAIEEKKRKKAMKNPAGGGRTREEDE